MVALLATIRVAPRASGGDLAASTFGGWLRYSAPDREALAGLLDERSVSAILDDDQAWAGFDVEHLPAPADLRLLVGWTGSPASTTKLVGVVRRHRDGDYAAFLDASRACVDDLTEGLRTGDAERTLAALRRARGLLQGLGTSVGSQIETPGSRPCATSSRPPAGPRSPPVPAAATAASRSSPWTATPPTSSAPGRRTTSGTSASRCNPRKGARDERAADPDPHEVGRTDPRQRQRRRGRARGAPRYLRVAALALRRPWRADLADDRGRHRLDRRRRADDPLRRGPCRQCGRRPHLRRPDPGPPERTRDDRRRAEPVREAHRGAPGDRRGPAVPALRVHHGRRLRPQHGDPGGGHPAAGDPGLGARGSATCRSPATSAPTRRPPR